MSDVLGLDTPCLLLDREALERNTARMRARMQRHAVTLRPHVKTAKSIDVARLAVGGARGHSDVPVVSAEGVETSG